MGQFLSLSLLAIVRSLILRHLSIQHCVLRTCFSLCVTGHRVKQARSAWAEDNILFTILDVEGLTVALVP